MADEQVRRRIKYLCLVVLLLVTPLGLLLGTLYGVISDFGLHETVDTIRLNPDTFADQYAGIVVRNGWAAVAITVVLILTGVCWFACGKGTRMPATITVAAEGDAILWICYPKKSSKKYKCDFNRDSGWTVLGAAGYEPVRMVAIDEDWSALRFRKAENIKTLTRSKTISQEGKKRATKGNRK